MGGSGLVLVHTMEVFIAPRREARSENFVSQIWEKVTASVESKIEIDGSDIKYWLVAARSAMTDRMFLQGRLRVNGRSVGEVVILEGKQV